MGCNCSELWHPLPLSRAMRLQSSGVSSTLLLLLSAKLALG